MFTVHALNIQNVTQTRIFHGLTINQVARLGKMLPEIGGEWIVALIVEEK